MTWNKRGELRLTPALRSATPSFPHNYRMEGRERDVMTMYSSRGPCTIAYRRGMEITANFCIPQYQYRRE
ncbi:hypothetical protein J6590_074448 [Homalodisca vitripennis]|nr:hypothetical protein J6590_074448 [Homalodisca vitripennis]